MGSGRVWDDAIIGRAAVTGRETMKEFAAFSPWDSGDIMLVLPSDSILYDIGQFDRIVAINRTEPFSVNYIRGRERISRFSFVSVSRVFWYIETEECQGDLPEIDELGALTWPDDSIQPPLGVAYSITGRRNPEYFVYQELPLDRAHQYGDRLPRRVVLRRFDIFGR
jgi:hypothetical protein